MPAPDEPLFIDVRSPGEFASGYLDGSLNLPLNLLQQGIGQVAPDLDTDLLLYCASGARSAFACAVLEQMGYTRARNGGGISMLAMTSQRAILRG